MEKDVPKACYEEKLKLLYVAFDELMSVLFAFETVVEPGGYRLTTRNEENKYVTFSETLKLWDKYGSTKRDIDPKTIEKRTMAAVKDFPEIELFIKGDEPEFPEFQFSSDPHKFLDQLISILILLVSAGEKGDPRADLLAMRALYFASSFISQFEKEGIRRSDIPVKAGSSNWKKKVSKQNVIEMFYKIDTNGKSKNAICKAVRDALVSQESKRGGKRREVYSTKHIGRILEEELKKIS